MDFFELFYREKKKGHIRSMKWGSSVYENGNEETQCGGGDWGGMSDEGKTRGEME